MRRVNQNGVMTPVMEKTLITAHAVRQQRSSLLWGFINASLLSVILYDIMYTCPLYSETFHLIELIIAVILGINTIFHFGRYFWTSCNFQPIVVTPLQKKIMGIKDADSYIQVKEELEYPAVSTPENCPMTPINLSPCSWITSPSNTPLSEFDDSKIGVNYSLSSSWIYLNGTQKPKTATPAVRKWQQTLNTSNDDIICDETSLSQYLKDYSGHEKSSSVGYSIEQPSNLLSMFWSHPVARSPAEATPILRKCAYQMAISSPGTEQATNIIHSSDEPGLSSFCDAEIWRRNKINSNNVIQWTANLRMWISQTILERLVSEFASINVSLQSHGLVDICIGEVGLDRLRKTAQTPQVVQNIPCLPCLVPFLEISPNQEYIVTRIKELTKGGCMSEFKWNGGGSLDGKEWGEHLPTDAALVLHLWATYLDSQLPPLPSTPESRPFSSLYLIKHPNKPTKVPLAISQVTENPPHYQLVTGEVIHYVPKGRNNLFHTILLFLHHIKIKEHGMLGRMNLGRSGVNMLWVIEN